MTMLINPFRFASVGVAGGIELVGSSSYFRANTSLPQTHSLTGLTGGIAAAPAIDDVVVLILARSNTTTSPLTVNTAGYTARVNIFGDDGLDTQLVVYTKRLTSAETSFETQLSGHIPLMAYVLRGVDADTMLDVATTTATGANSAIADPPAITPVTSGAFILCCGSGGDLPGADFTGADLDNFQSKFLNDSFDCVLGVGTKEWDGAGAFDAAAFGGSSASGNASWAAAALAFRPA